MNTSLCQSRTFSAIKLNKVTEDCLFLFFINKTILSQVYLRNKNEALKYFE